MSQDVKITDGMPCVAVIDDDDSVRHMVKSMIKYSAQVGVLDFADGKQALSFLLDPANSKIEIDAIVCDIVMPGLNGHDFLLELRSADINVPVILLSGNVNADALAHGLRLGAFDVAEKPCDKKFFMPSLEIAMSVGSRRRNISENLNFIEKTLKSGDLSDECSFEILKRVDEINRDRRMMSLLELRNYSLKSHT